jgi:hypothetical protein
VRRARGANEHGRIGRSRPLPEDCRQQRLRVASAADHAIQQRELERRLPRRLPGCQRLEQRLRLGVLAARERQLRENRNGRRIGRAARPRDPLRVLALAMGQSDRRPARRIRLCRLRRIRAAHGRAGCPERNQDDDYEEQPC